MAKKLFTILVPKTIIVPSGKRINPVSTLIEKNLEPDGVSDETKQEIMNIPFISERDKKAFIWEEATFAGSFLVKPTETLEKITNGGITRICDGNEELLVYYN